MKSKTIIIIISALLLLIILLQNTQVVEFRFFFWKIGMSRIVLLILTLLVGYVIGFLTRPLLIKKGKSDNHPSTF
jgi:uncharacterized integral membrane protein